MAFRIISAELRKNGQELHLTGLLESTEDQTHYQTMLGFIAPGCTIPMAPTQQEFHLKYEAMGNKLLLTLPPRDRDTE